MAEEVFVYEGRDSRTAYYRLATMEDVAKWMADREMKVVFQKKPKPPSERD